MKGGGMKGRINHRKRKIFEALAFLGGEATTREVARSLGMNVNGVSQTLGVLANVLCLGGRGGDCRWRII